MKLAQAQKRIREEEMSLLSANISTSEVVHAPRKHASTDISVLDASNMGMERILV